MRTTVSLDFYFAPDHPLNGRYFATPSAQLTGTIMLAFNQLPYLEGDSLTFSVVETYGNGSLNEYIFIQGIFRGSGDPVNQCPIRIGCNTLGKGLKLYFDPNFIQIGAMSATQIEVFAPGTGINRQYNMTGFILQENALVTKWIIYEDCADALQGRVIILINGLTCVFENGLLVSSDACTPWSEYYENSPDCAALLEYCAPQILNLFSGNKHTLPCEQWTDPAHHCSTTGVIERSGKVAVGTSGFSSSLLTVKNGIITDRAKIQLQTEWGDYVFEKSYPLMPLADVDRYIRQYHRLPGLPSTAEVEAAGGLDIGAITEMQQVKIEELFLHLIAIEAEIKSMEQEVALLSLLNKMRIR